MKYRSFFLFFIIGILTVTALYYYADGRMIRKEYGEYRDGVFSRAYETVLSDLSDYLTEEGASSSRVITGLSALPLSEEEIETVRRFSEDMANRAHDGEAGERAMEYAETLFRYLSGHRTASYEKSWRATGLGLPSYPEGSLSVSATPEDSTLLRDTLATRLLKRQKTVTYQRSWGTDTVYGYRTASSYAEMTEEGRLLRYLRAVTEDTPCDEESAEAVAIMFLENYRWSGAVLSEGERRDNTLLFPFTHTEGDGVIGVGPDGVFLFRVNGR